MKNSEVKELSTQEIVERMGEEKSHLIKLRLNHAVSPLDNPMKIKAAQKNVARLQTELRKRQLSVQK
ncbi:MAG: 50S ribosomal protein L29 [Bacteroidetes bacterium GWF2_38_335]|nr:MAG: 50S ribosomal protein L29 [Bacteroidetes bacterium GWF2_38_335]OFY81384.1 MAG: 50S ribosomal protein L29 [Bacteroidetes bacterium RIFOXYA12_FULL_38_20]HBS85507.1 50S ribosomal protein L29 [Bacteroidales bacterium]